MGFFDSVRLTKSEQKIALFSFTVKVLIYLVAENIICHLDHQRIVCRLIGKGFMPCLFSFAIMDVLVIPQIRRFLQRK